MSQIADWIIPSHFRELNLSRSQRQAAKEISERRRQQRTSPEGAQEQSVEPTDPAGVRDFRRPPAGKRAILFDSDDS